MTLSAPSPAEDALRAIFAQLRAIADAGELTGKTVINWANGVPRSMQVEAVTGPREVWRLPALG